MAIALGVQTKGPIALVLCGLTMLLLMALSADLRRRLLALHWATRTADHRGGVDALVRLHVRAVQGRIRQRLHPRRELPPVREQPVREPARLLVLLPILAAALLPWTGLLIGRLIDDVRAIRRGERLDGVETMLLGWTLAVVGFFTLSTFKLDHYVFPAAPGAVPAVRARLVRRPGCRPGDAHRASRAGLYCIAPFLVAVGVGCGYFLMARLELPLGRRDGADWR